MNYPDSFGMYLFFIENVILLLWQWLVLVINKLYIINDALENGFGNLKCFDLGS